jgi:subtilisin family serine protease
MKKIIILLATLPIIFSVMAQKKGKAPSNDWYQNDLTKSNWGTDVKKAYSELLKDKKGQEIVVAVIDGGTDVSHPDLKANIWKNAGEIPNNGIDDDLNGYVDDTCGWNFIGGADGKMVEYDNLEKTRILRDLMKKYEDLDASDITGDPQKRAEYEYYQKLKAEVEEERKTYEGLMNQFSPVIKALDGMTDKMGTKNPTKADFEKYEPRDKMETFLKTQLIKSITPETPYSSIYSEIREPYNQFYSMANYHYNTDFDPRGIVGDNYLNSGEKNYGNNNVAGPDAFHGTHVAGIIGAVRNNGYGMDGNADHVKIMVVRVVPNGDERDKDVANGIRYAVDNGAKIINMSFGKSFKFNKAVVDSAVAYAVSKGVLLVHAAGNDNEDNDNSPNYPNDSMSDGSFASTWMEIGASSPDKKQLATNFSNYGKHNVDVFAPGYQIYSTAPNNQYKKADGTSMAAPVTSGIAALVWSYYPSLTALQLKEVLMKSAVVNKKSVLLPGSKKEKVKFTELSVSGGVVNAYKALQMAAMITGK